MADATKDAGSSAWYRNNDMLEAALRRGPLVAPPEIPGYEALTEIGRGAQAVVYGAVQRSTRRKVAIKLLLAGEFASPSAVRRFQHEIDVLSQLQHPNIVNVIDSGDVAGRHFIVMEFVDGRPLGDFWASIR